MKLNTVYLAENLEFMRDLDSEIFDQRTPHLLQALSQADTDL